MPTKQGKKVSPKADKQVAPDMSGKARSHANALHDSSSPLKMRIAYRRNLVAQLYLTGAHTIDTISEYLRDTFEYKISRVQIADDIKQLRKIWAKNAEMTTADHLTAELDKLQQLEVFSVEQLRLGVWSQEKFIQETVRVMKRRHSILGLDKSKLEVTDRRLEDLTDAELAAIAAPKKDSDAA